MPSGSTRHRAGTGVLVLTGIALLVWGLTDVPGHPAMQGTIWFALLFLGVWLLYGDHLSE